MVEVLIFALFRVQESMPPPPTPANPAPASTGGALTGPSPDKLTFSAKKRFFEKEIAESTQPAAKPGKDHIFTPVF